MRLKRSEALFYAGRCDDAKALHQIASTLDLSATDKIQLANDLR